MKIKHFHDDSVNFVFRLLLDKCDIHDREEKKEEKNLLPGKCDTDDCEEKNEGRNVLLDKCDIHDREEKNEEKNESSRQGSKQKLQIQSYNSQSSKVGKIVFRFVFVCVRSSREAS